TLAEYLENVADIPEVYTIIHKLDYPIKKTGHLQILKGNVSPEGSVAKITGKEGEIFEGVANVYDSEEEMVAAVEIGKVK
ncbi:dihydroxy-acid dehydratase, partial [Francisella tularensis subsp. holarctica]|uniref:dihydroxy-acid dehydratase domain-containing protein n=1 Tax=Francisella tularensis TaxID=263 RepID=UPI002381CCF8